ncbi:tRNA1(Val) (adenine(37)-N6)-methyltransferase [Neptunitalea lumnitzerae]|uniref:tRNA1(Val) (adenine(37)-N6)-methyltransferase n=1 Tax=Neptunitalea lumnitzerae TaxID=2965509 RepID=A0ABQ5MGQ8_9FLAO|nr:methyltransferase [Neptunitalea sp. Y10]GLB48601.1 tRNA1(Val) (adenine(37)-N6)-methyltransferase [Neptunitalea sp. Y10]
MAVFQFKQFAVEQDKCAMKIGTDGVLLGAWAKLGEYPGTILDVGAGTGLVALMAAQRSDAPTIDAVEIDDDAHEQCVENFEASNWSDRLFCYHAEFTEFVAEMYEEEEVYDVIISNPPFYAEDYSSGNTQRDIARLNEALPFEDLIEGTSLLLATEGVFNVIIPYKEEVVFIETAAKFNMYPFKMTRVKGNPDAEVKRSLLAFSFQEQDCEMDELTIELARHEYTPEYVNLTREFYLKM